MINSGIFRTSENLSSTQNVNKQVTSEQKLPRMKSKALGDVQNTLHSRPANFGNAVLNSAVKASNKSSVQVKPPFESHLSNKNTTSGKRTSVTPCKSEVKLLLTPNISDEMFETHDHLLCEEDHKSIVNDFFSEYKFSEEQIKNLVRSVKVCVSPFSVPLYEPCEDLDLPDGERYEEDSFCVNDILDDIILDDSLPEIPPVW